MAELLRYLHESVFVGFFVNKETCTALEEGLDGRPCGLVEVLEGATDDEGRFTDVILTGKKETRVANSLKMRLASNLL